MAEKEVDIEETASAAAAEGEKTTSTVKSRRELRMQAQNAEYARQQQQEQNQRFVTGWDQLSNAMRTGSIIYGKAISVYTADLSGTAEEGTGSAVFLCINWNGQFKILVPFHEIYRHYPLDRSTIDLSTSAGVRNFVQRQKSMTEKLYGTEVPVVITAMSHDGELNRDNPYTIVASRAKALAIIEHNNYTPDKSGFTPVTEGSFVDANIISVSSRSLQVNVAGVDTTIQVHDLTYSYVNSDAFLAAHYSAGEKLPVKVMSIVENEDGTHRIRASHKPVELAEANSSPLALSEGERTTAIITRITERNDKPIFHLYLREFKRPAYAIGVKANTLGVSPMVGDVVRVTISKILDDGMLRVKISHLHGSADLFNRL